MKKTILLLITIVIISLPIYSKVHNAQEKIENKQPPLLQPAEKATFELEGYLRKRKVSVFRGPLLLTYDARFNGFDSDQIPQLDLASLSFKRHKSNGEVEPWVQGVLQDKSGAQINVCDFSSAGQTGNQYRSWLPMKKETKTAK